MPKRSSKRPKGDLNTNAFSVVQQATGRAKPEPAPKEKNPAAVALGRLGGIKGGNARAASLSDERRSEIAKKAAEKRWSEKRK